MLVCSSRLYLGMHSVADILAGLTLSSVFLPLFAPFGRFDCLKIEGLNKRKKGKSERKEGMHGARMWVGFRDDSY